MKCSYGMNYEWDGMEWERVKTVLRENIESGVTVA